MRTRSISAGLLASTVTPGITAPLVSRTTPAMPLACANAGRRHEHRRTTSANTTPRTILAYRLLSCVVARTRNHVTTLTNEDCELRVTVCAD